jgi:hypothetical protein
MSEAMTWLQKIYPRRKPTVRFDRVVSLGRSCQPAFQIRRYTGIEDAQLLDWVVTPDSALCHVLANSFEGWFQKDRLDFVPGSHAVDRVSGVRFLHEFDKAESLDEGHRQHAGRMARLLFRWRALMISGERLLFVRSHFDEPDVLACARRLVEVLQQSTSNPFEVLYLVPPVVFDPSHRIAGVTFAALDPKPEGFDWKGDNAAWDRVLAEVGAPPLGKRALPA